MAYLFERPQRWQNLGPKNGFSDSPNSRKIRVSFYPLGKMNRSRKKKGEKE